MLRGEVELAVLGGGEEGFPFGAGEDVGGPVVLVLAIAQLDPAAGQECNLHAGDVLDGQEDEVRRRVMRSATVRAGSRTWACSGRR